MSRGHFAVMLGSLAAASLVTGLIAGRLLGGPAFAQEDVPEVIEASELRVVDDTGATRAMMGLTDGEARLHLRYEDGSPCVDAGVRPDGSVGISVYDLQGHQRSYLGTLPDGAAVMHLMDPQGEYPCVALAAESDGRKGVTLADAPGRPAVELELDPDGRRRLEFSTQDGATGCTLALSPEQNLAELHLGGRAEDMQQVHIEAAPESSSLMVGQPQQGASAMLRVEEAGSRLEMRDDTGRLRVQAHTDQGRPEVAVLDGWGSTRAHMFETELREYGMVALDAGRVPVFGLPFTPRPPEP